MVRINKITNGLVKATVLAKVETFNPGNSIKDRMAVKMIEDAERAGLLRPGGIIIEGTSGNTGMSLAIAAVVKGYKCIFTTTDKQSKEKTDALKAVWCGGDRLPDQRRSRRSSFVLLGVVPAPSRCAEFMEGRPVRQRGELAGALRADGPRDLESNGWEGYPPRGRRGNRRHRFRRGPVSQRAESED